MPAIVRRLAVAATVVAFALSTAACTDASPRPTASESPTAEAPIFASDEEALAAAEEAYRAYLAEVDHVSNSGGKDLGRLEAVVAPGYLEDLLSSVETLKSSGNHTTGTTHFDEFRLMERAQADSIAEVSVYACLDVTEVRVIGADGSDITPAARDSRTPMIARFVSSSAGSDLLVPSGSEPWTGDDFC